MLPAPPASVILAHPNLASLNHALAGAAVDILCHLGYDVCLHDLYAEGFDPLLPAAEFPRNAALPGVIQQHCDELARAQAIVIVHPNWWGQPPAILKGWIDRVVRPGVAYRFREGDAGDGVPEGLLVARAAVVLNTSNTPPHRGRQVFGDPLERLWKDCVFGLCGVARIGRRVFGPVVTSSLETRRAWIAQAQDLISRTLALDADRPPWLGQAQSEP